MPVTKQSFGKNIYGESTDLYTLRNAGGVTVRIMTHGGTIVTLETPDRNGRTADIVHGFDTAEEYAGSIPYFGCAVGRFANRIKEGRFTLDGRTYTLAVNNGPNALHGGLRGFDKVIWKTQVLPDGNSIQMTYVSPDGEEGFPGTVTTRMTYELTDSNELKIRYEAETDKATPFNITNHSYFNLAGHNAGEIGNHILTLNADTFLPTDATSIPYGRMDPVAGTPFDFRRPHSIGERIDADHEQIRFGSGYDHNFCLNKKAGSRMSLAARVKDPASGRIMEVHTTEPGVQFYSANFLDGTLKGKKGTIYKKRSAFCLETQHYPDSPNQPQFPDTILRPGKPFSSMTVLKFSAE